MILLIMMKRVLIGYAKIVIKKNIKRDKLYVNFLVRIRNGDL